MTATAESSTARQWPDYRAVWRWHFYAGLFCMPFVLVLSISGSIYLFKPQIEAWSDRECDNLVFDGQPASIADQVSAALGAVPGSGLVGYELPPTPRGAGRVIVKDNAESVRVYVHPKTLNILKQVQEDQRFTRWVFRVHGELLMGDRGSNIVELAASWTIVMIITGLYLWWPRNANGLGGIVYPRLRRGSRVFWRDIHSVIGMWVSAFVLFLLLTGLPWAKFWGNYFKMIRAATGTAVAQQDWTTGSEKRMMSGGGGHEGHGGGGRGKSGGWSSEVPIPKDLTAFDRVAATVIPLGLEAPVTISPPAKKGSEQWSAKSMTPNRPRRTTLMIDGSTGNILSREELKDRHWVDRAVGFGIAAHEGQLFGWPNQLLGLLTALGLVAMSVSGVIMWWRRRDQGVLGAPKVLASGRFSIGLVIVIMLLGIYLPLFGASLLLVLLVEKTVLRRIPKVRDWLGLSSQNSAKELELPTEEALAV